MRAAAEAMVVAVLVDVEAGRLLAVERAAALPLPTRPGEPHAPPDHRRQRCAGAQFVEEGGGQRHQRAPSPNQLPQGAGKNVNWGGHDSLAFTIGPAFAMSSVAACFARNAAITLPMSLMLAAPVSAIASATACGNRGLVHLLRQEGLDDRDLGLLLVHQVRSLCPADTVPPTRGATSPCRAACRRFPLPARARCPWAARRCRCPSAGRGSCAAWRCAARSPAFIDALS